MSPAPPRLDLNLVRVFVTIYEARSVTRAAERLALTQPTLSHALARLREAYGGDSLFRRAAGRLVPTSVGEQLYQRFSQALASIDSTLEPRQRFIAAQSTRRFRIAMSDVGALSFTSALLRQIQSRAPRVEIDIEKIGEQVADDLALGRLDAVVGNQPALLASTSSAPLFRERYVCVMSVHHPTIRQKLTLAQFVASRHIMVVTPTRGNQLIDEALAERKLARKVVARVPHFMNLPQLLDHTDLLVLVPNRVAQMYVRLGGIKALPLPIAVPEFEVRVHWHVRNESSKAHQWLVEQITAALGQA
ncbi:MAG TPA: LysR family transcriptional regulator [Ramlibacter sp.]|uniref:LysR family transcriptional regulator n=1 Tax=Ramlibacter sp. TaxID=1917967 RepID=UPI002C6469A4|nr:LysR family transcriptional regulator [Ramlibacter sp.]HVZ45742.1 LysR family transcriptional regulator [Ramlibacter sp.]